MSYSCTRSQHGLERYGAFASDTNSSEENQILGSEGVSLKRMFKVLPPDVKTIGRHAVDS